MSLDRDYNSGIGYEVESAEVDVCYWSLLEELESKVGDTFSVFIAGCMWTGAVDSLYIVIDDPFRCGNNLNYVKTLLDEEVKRLNLRVVSDFDVVGGILIC